MNQNKDMQNYQLIDKGSINFDEWFYRRLSIYFLVFKMFVPFSRGHSTEKWVSGKTNVEAFGLSIDLPLRFV